MRIISLIALSILLIFALAGLIFTGNIIHELSHQEDYKKISYGGSICLLSYPENFSWNSFINSPLAYYHFRADNQTEYDRVEQYTELRAYGLDVILIGIFFIAIYVVVYKWFIYREYERQFEQRENFNYN